MNNAGEGMGEINYIQVAVAATEIEIPEELGQSKRKRVSHKLADTLNGCLQGVCRTQENYTRSFLGVKWLWDSKSAFRFLVVLFLPRPQNRARKSLCNLWALKPCRVDFTRQQQFLTIFLRGTVYV